MNDTEEDIRKLVENAQNLRDKALIFSLYESGCRIGEILTLNINNVNFDEYGAILLVTGKTGDRRVRLIASAPLLSSWIENHPRNSELKAPLWVNFSTNNRYGRLGYSSAKLMIKKVAVRAGIKKRVFPHLSP